MVTKTWKPNFAPLSSLSHVFLYLGCAVLVLYCCKTSYSEELFLRMLKLPSLGKKDLRKGKIQDIRNIFLLRYQPYTVQETLSNLYLIDSCSV